MTRDLDDAHHEIAALDAGQPRRVERVGRRHPQRASRGSCRRRRVAGRSCSVAVRCSAGSRSSAAGWAAASRPPRPARAWRCPRRTSAQKLSGDLAVVALAASLENLAVGTYQAGIDAATKGSLGDVPPAVVTFADDRAEPAPGPRRGVERRAHRRGQEGGHRRRPHGEEVGRQDVRRRSRTCPGSPSSRSTSRTSPRPPTSPPSTW